jgi:hypothetical protein
VWAWLAAFVFTQLIEAPIYARALAVRPLVAFGASAITHPLVWIAVSHPAVPGSHLKKVIAAELFAWLVEALYFHLWGKRRVLLWSGIANGASLTLGLLSRALFGAP